MKYKLDSLFLDRHGVYYLVSKLPIFTIRKDKKIVYTDENYELVRVPDVLEYKSKLDNSTVRFTLPTLKINEERIEDNLRKENWKKI